MTATLGELSEGRNLLEVSNLVVTYRVGGQVLAAVSDVDFEVRRGETLGLVGESGCGKSSAGLAVLRLGPASSGRIMFDGTDLSALSPRALRRVRRNMQIVFQDPAKSLNPRRTVRKLVEEGLAISGSAKPWRQLVDDTLRAVGLDPDVIGSRTPSELSGGQCQRVAIARAIVLRPALLVCDEAVSALDVSVQAQILNLLEDMKESFSFSMLFIGHDLAVVRNVSDRVAVMYLGRICEVLPSASLATDASHPYSLALLSSIPEPDPDIAVVPMLVDGDVPSPLRPPSGCRFRTRCPRAQELCAREVPELKNVGIDHQLACHFPVVE